jgi:hypothetical protein
LDFTGWRHNFRILILGVLGMNTRFKPASPEELAARGLAPVDAKKIAKQPKTKKVKK